MQAGTSLTPEMTAEEAFTANALGAAADFVAHLQATMQEDDPHGPHQARVALRRLRTMLDAYEPILDPDFVDDLRGESRRIFRHLGQIRDADILLAAAGSEQERGKRLKAATETRETSRKRLRRGDAAGFADRLEARLRKKGWKAGGKRAREWRKSPVAVLAGSALDEAWEDIQPQMPLDGMSGRTLHNLRKYVKSMRYMTEFFGPVIGHGDWRASLESLKGLQDKMGQITDMALAGTSRDDPARAPLVAEASALLRLVIALGPWWLADSDSAED